MNRKDPEYIFEDKNGAEGTTLTLMKTPAGVLVGEILRDNAGREIENKSYDASGNIIRRTAYDWDDQRKPVKTTTWDAKGNLISIHERGKPPIFYGEHQAGAPPFMRADNQKKP